MNVMINSTGMISSSRLTMYLPIDTRLLFVSVSAHLNPGKKVLPAFRCAEKIHPQGDRPAAGPPGMMAPKCLNYSARVMVFRLNCSSRRPVKLMPSRTP